MKGYAFAGASNRALTMYARPILEWFPETSRIAGVFDTNSTRAAYVT